jgi:hypothetical protein
VTSTEAHKFDLCGGDLVVPDRVTGVGNKFCHICVTKHALPIEATFVYNNQCVVTLVCLKRTFKKQYCMGESKAVQDKIRVSILI